MPHVVSELERQPLLRWKLAEPVAQPVMDFRVEHGVGALFGIFIQTACCGMVLLAAYGFKRRAIGDAENPGRDLRGGTKIAGAAPNYHEGIVDDLLHVLITRSEARQETS